MIEMVDNFWQIEKTTIDIGLKREYKFFQFSDLHLSYNNKNSSKTDNDDFERTHNQWDSLKREMASKFGEFCDERYDIPFDEILERIYKYAKKEKADAVICSGDVMDRVTESNLEYLGPFFKSSEVQTVFCLGNHESIQENGEYHNLYSRINRITEDSEFYVYDFDGFEIVSIDNGRREISDRQIELFEKEIKKGKKIILLIHIPLKLGKYGEEINKKVNNYFVLGTPGDSENVFKFMDLVKKNDKQIVAVLSGHIHTAFEGPITDNLMQYTASSALIGYLREICVK